MAVKIPCVIMRGGTSKGVFFHEKDLPKDPQERDKVILSAFGSPDVRQVDGLGGADPLTSKVAIIGASREPGTDLNYTFGYVGIANALVDYKGNCGNISSAVGPFAIEEGLVAKKEPITPVKIYNTNTKKVIVAEIPVKDGRVLYEGDYRIDGVPGVGAKILLDFVNSGGAVTGKLLPTGKKRETLNLGSSGTFTISVVDAANPFVFIIAEELGIKKPITPDEIAADTVLCSKLEAIRSAVAEMIGIVDDKSKATSQSPAIPKVAFLSSPKSYKAYSSGSEISSNDVDLLCWMMALQKPHKAYAVTGAICTGAAVKIEGTVANELASEHAKKTSEIRLGHPSGILGVEMIIEGKGGELILSKAAVARTARRIMDGFVYIK